MQMFPTLYKRDSKGSIREWRMEADGCNYRTIAGLQEGQQVQSAWTIAEPKNVGRSNATTAEEQAISEIKSHYTKKLDVDYYDNVNEIDIPKIFEPMLAKKWEDRFNKIDYSGRVFVQPKLDGIRCIITRHGAFSRSGMPIVAIPHIINMLVPLFDEEPDAVIDGELYNHDLKHDFNSIVSMVRKTKLTVDDISLSAKMIQYHVYDYPGLMHEPFNVRMDKLVQLCHNETYKPTIQVVPTFQVHGQENVDAIYGKFLQEGYEGGIIRLNGTYEQKRSGQLLKRKDFDDDEFEIVNVLEGKGNWAGCAKTVVVKTKDGTLCEPTIQGSMDYCTHVLINSSNYIGKMATVRFFGYTPDGSLRFPIAKILHDDKRW